MQIIGRFPTLVLAALLSGACLPAHAGTMEPYRDLPGVKVPKQIDKQARANCSSHIEEQWPTYLRNGRLNYRVYECGDGNVTVKSTRPPNEIDWQKRQEYYKPWTSDGF